MKDRKKRTAGRPKKIEGESVRTALWLPAQLLDGVRKHKERELLTGDSEAIRDLLKRALRTEGLL